MGIHTRRIRTRIRSMGIRTRRIRTRIRSMGIRTRRPADNRKEEPGKGFAVASMVLGLISLVLFCTGINIITAILAIVFGIIHLVKQKQNHGMAVAGIVTAVVGILAFVTYWLLIIHAAGPDEFLRRYEYQFDGEMKAPDDYQDLEDYLQHNFENF